MTSKILKMCFGSKINQKPCFDNLLTTFRRVFNDFSTSFRRLFDDFSTTLRRVFDGSSTKRRDGKNEKGYHDIPPNLRWRLQEVSHES